MKKQIIVLFAGLLVTAGCGLQPVHAERQALKVCSAENEMPYSNKKGEGFENKLAEIIADELGRKVEFVTWADPRYIVRDFLDKGLCDVVIGMDAGDPRVLTTKPYYRSGYVFITRTEGTDEIKSWDDEALRKAERIAFVPGTPPEVMMRAIGRYNDMFNYMHELAGFKSRRNEYIKYENEKLVSEVSGGKADVAVLWGPAAARYVKASSTSLTMTLIPDDNKRADGEKVGFHYSTSLGVRKDDTALLKELEKAVENRSDEITQILQAEGIPLVDEPEQVLVSK
ncbi:methanol oxidation system protein MoxJ [Methylicorpusculum sp.]|uniref:methanol oxidation system protein MoxJ n=1 Tax=Methylicorpusculum sp. TaxID=2713644 RepID=UPI0027159125|nr:methanol oxidation system protein MoxJ [Methylicorpusculum sp.]MDO8843577.1 methanol oxidation system protein MoxJ [Methylicorpusculum sp.]